MDRRLLLLILMAVVILYILILSRLQSESELSTHFVRAAHPVREKSVINIAIVACAGEKDFTSTKTTKEALTLIKSVLISMKLYHLDEKVALHLYLFTDPKPYQEYLQAEIANYVEAVNGTGSVQTSFYSSLAAIPQTLKNLPGTTLHVSSFTRLFFPEVFPPEVKMVLSLDADVLVTGNIERIWNAFSKPILRNNSILAGMIGETEPGDTKFPEIFELHRARPYVPPKGVNAGIIFMNLEGMRKVNWTAQCHNICLTQNRSKNWFNEQPVINEYFHFNLDKLHILGCQYNFQFLRCERGWACKTATEDPAGIQLLHGIVGTFQQPNFALSVFQAFNKFNMSDHAQAVEKLLIPLKQSFRDNLEKRNVCEGFFSFHLFPQINSQLNSTETAKGQF